MYIRMKRLMDILFSFSLMFLISPLIIIISIAIKIESRGPVLFKQKRVGINKEHFYILKFRTMRSDTPSDTPTHLLDSPELYITKLGKFLRKTSLDELPQIWNIFVGEMSFVGPRPALWNQFDLIKERDKYNANNILPGLTGWAQVNGRDELPIEVKAKLNGDYLKSISFFLDIRCLILTVVRVIRSEGVYEGSTTKVEKENPKRVEM